MPELEVSNAQISKSAGQLSVATGNPAGNGDLAAEVARLRQEVGDRLASAFEGFHAASALLHGASDTMGALGVPPGFAVIHALGECSRRFLRLRSELFNRATALGVATPPIETFIGLSDLARFVEGLAHGLPTVVTPALPDEPAIESPALQSVPVDPTPASAPIANDLQFDPLPEAESVSYVVPPAADLFVAPATDDSLPSLKPDAPEWLEPSVPQPPSAEHSGESTRRSALMVLDRALSLTTRDGSDFAPLAEFLESTRALRYEVCSASANDLPDAAEPLSTGGHPIAGLMQVIDGVEGLTDAQWAALHTQVTQTFGRQMAIAAARGRFLPTA